MADVLLTHCNHLYFDRKQVRKMQPYPPLQTLLAAACLRRAGFDVALFDSTFVPPEDGFREAIERHRPRLVALVEDNFNFLTKMCLTQNRELAFSMTRIARDRRIPVLANGSDAIDQARAYLENGVNFVITGELETTLLETTQHVLSQTNGAFRGIPGLAYLAPESGSVQYTARRPLMCDLGWLPTPAWDLIAIEPYRQAWRDAHGYFSLNLVSSRGCPYRCNWCAKPLFGDSYHHRSAAAVAAEMEFLKRSYQPDQIWFADDIFALSARWTQEFAASVESLNAQIPFKMQSRCDLMTRDTVAALARAGCAEVWMGAESGSQKILDAMDKDTRVTHIGEARENLRAHGIRACYFLQFGYPGETWDDIQATIRLVRETKPDDIGVSVSYPLPGTRFYERVASQLGSKRNWSDSDDLAMMFQGAYQTRFYKALHEALHLEVDCLNGRAPQALGEAHLASLWKQVEELERTCANAQPTVLWTCC
jgi:radical SAM superfamily enzyme YgiQ (UPF0313 family)